MIAQNAPPPPLPPHSPFHTAPLRPRAQATLSSAAELMTLLDRSDRTTRATAQNTTSSRSHAVLQISVVEGGEGWGKEQVRGCEGAGAEEGGGSKVNWGAVGWWG